MNLSTRIKKSGFLLLCGDGDTATQKIVLLVDCKERIETYSLRSADIRHKEFLRRGCTLLTKESPVYNASGEIIFHYTSTTYKEWCAAPVSAIPAAQFTE